MAVFAVDVPLRWVDLDAQGHANNAAFVDYMQEGRVEVLMRSPNAHLLGHGLIVTGHRIEYLRSIDYTTEPLRAELRIGDVGAARFVLAYRIFQRGQLVARARSGCALFDFESQRPRRMTSAERGWFCSVSEKVDAFKGLGGWRVGEPAHVFPFQVRWSDVDSYGHVNNVRFFEYVTEARVALHRSLDPDALPTGLGDRPENTWMLARQDLRYVGQITHRLEPYLVRTSVAQVGTTSMTTVARIEDPLDGRQLARSITVLVHGDSHGRPTKISDAVREGAARWPATHKVEAFGRDFATVGRTR